MEFTWVFHVLHEVLYCENSKMRFLWHHNNRKIDHILQLQYASFKLCSICFKVRLKSVNKALCFS